MDIEQAKPLTNWKNEPSVGDLKNDYINCKSSHDTQVGIIDQYMVNLRADPLQFKKKESPRSRVQPKLIRKQAERRYASLSEPFLATEDIFRVNPVTYEDTYAANQNELVLNYQFNTQLNKIKLIDDYVRAAVDTGTAIIRVGWEERTEYQDVPKPLYVPQPIDAELQTEDYARFERVQRVFHDDVRSGVVPDHWKQCVIKSEQETQQRNDQIQQQAIMQAQQQIAMAQQQMQQMQMELMQAQIAKLQAEVQKLGADAGLSEARAQSEMVEAQMKPQELQVKAQSEMSKAMYNNAMSKKLDLDYMHELDGTQHQRDMEKQAAQANAQADKSARERYMDISAKEQEYGYKAEIERLKAQTKLQEAQIKARAQALKSKSL